MNEYITLGFEDELDKLSFGVQDKGTIDYMRRAEKKMGRKLTKEEKSAVMKRFGTGYSGTASRMSQGISGLATLGLSVPIRRRKRTNGIINFIKNTESQKKSIKSDNDYLNS